MTDPYPLCMFLSTDIIQKVMQIKLKSDYLVSIILKYRKRKVSENLKKKSLEMKIEDLKIIVRQIKQRFVSKVQTEVI